MVLKIVLVYNFILKHSIHREKCFVTMHFVYDYRGCSVHDLLRMYEPNMYLTLENLNGDREIKSRKQALISTYIGSFHAANFHLKVADGNFQDAIVFSCLANNTKPKHNILQSSASNRSHPTKFLTSFCTTVHTNDL